MNAENQILSMSEIIQEKWENILRIEAWEKEAAVLTFNLAKAKEHLIYLGHKERRYMSDMIRSLPPDELRRAVGRLDALARLDAEARKDGESND